MEAKKLYPPGTHALLELLGFFPRILERPFFFELSFVLTPADPTVKQMQRVRG